MEQQIQISPEPQAERIPATTDPNMIESHEDGCSCEHDSDGETPSCEHDCSAEMKESGTSEESCGNGENEPGLASMNSTRQAEEKINSVSLRQEEQCSQEQNQQIKEEAMQVTGQDSQGMAEAPGGQSAAPAAPGQTPQQPQQEAGQTPQQQAPPQAQPQQAMPQGQPQQAAVDPAAYAAWQQAVWQQQMAAAQAQAMQSGYYAYAPPHVAASPEMAQDSSANPHHPKHDAHKYGQVVQMAEKFVKGEADISDVVNGISLLENQDSQFWRGLLVGGVATLVLTSDQVKNGMARLFQRSEADE